MKNKERSTIWHDTLDLLGLIGLLVVFYLIFGNR